jgi:hypothetical protein
MTGLLRAILIIAAVYYIIKLLIKYVMPYVAKYFIKKMQRNYGTQSGYSDHKKEGEVIIEKKGKQSKEKIFEKNEGDYIDYDEVKE